MKELKNNLERKMMINLRVFAFLIAALLGASCGKKENPGNSNENPINQKSGEISNVAEVCRLAQPIDISTDDPRKNSVTLVDAEFDQAIQTGVISSHGPYAIELFEIKNDVGDVTTSTGFLGGLIMNLSSLGKSDESTLGFTEFHEGNSKLTGKVEDKSGELNFQTTEEFNFKRPKGNATMTWKIHAVIKSHKLLSLQLTIPVDKTSSDAQSFIYLGLSQTLCLKKANAR